MEMISETNWTKGYKGSSYHFVNSIMKQAKSRKTLSKKQMEAVSNLYVKVKKILKKVKKSLDTYTNSVVYSHMKKRKKTMNFGKFVDADTFTYWVNKKTGTTHMVRADVDWSGDLKLSTTTLNLRYERDYFFRKDAVARFLKNYDFVCENPNTVFWSKVLANKQLKSELSWGLKTKGRLGITKDEFFDKIKGEA